MPGGTALTHSGVCARGSIRADGVNMCRWNKLVRERLALGDESGIALVMALGIMLVLTIALTTTIHFTSAGARHANTATPARRRSRSPRPA